MNTAAEIRDNRIRVLEERVVKLSNELSAARGMLHVERTDNDRLIERLKRVEQALRDALTALRVVDEARALS